MNDTVVIYLDAHWHKTGAYEYGNESTPKNDILCLQWEQDDMVRDYSNNIHHQNRHNHQQVCDLVVEASDNRNHYTLASLLEEMGRKVYRFFQLADRNIQVVPFQVRTVQVHKNMLLSSPLLQVERELKTKELESI